MTDVTTDYERAVAEYEPLRAAFIVECEQARSEGREPDAYLKLQYRAAGQNVSRLRSFWRAIDMTVAMDDENFARPTGDGRRGGERVHIVDNVPVDDESED